MGFDRKANERIICMKLLIAADIFPPESGGPATYAVTLANEFTKQGIEVKIVSLNPNSDKTKVTCPLFAVESNFKPLRYWQYYKLLLAHGRDADVIYAMGPVNAGWPALRAARKLGKKFVVKVVGDYAWEQWQNRRRLNEKFVSVDEFQNLPLKGKIALLRQVERRVVQSADKVIVPSEYLKNIVLWWGAKLNNLEVVYNAIEYTKVEPIKHPEERWIVSVARLTPWKGMGALIGIMPGLVKKLPDVKLKIVGSGSEIEKLNLKIQNLKLKDSVKLLGELPRRETLEYIASANLFVLNSGYEGLSHALLEARIMNKPIFASNVGGNPELVQNAVYSFLFEYNDQDMLGKKIEEFFEETSKVVMGVEQDAHFLEKFKFETMIKKTKELLESL